MAIVPVDLPQLTQAEVDGTGVFDVLMQASRKHLDQEYKLGRIKGPEYSQVYLSAIQPVLQAALQFLLTKDKTTKELELLDKQIELAGVEVEKAQAELAILQANQQKIPAEIALLTAQTALTNQQTTNALKELGLIAANICKAQAEYDVLMESKLKTAEEKTLLIQKTATEKAQTQGLGVDEDSIIGKQKALYQSQSDGIKRDAENKAAQIMVNSWQIRRTTDSGTIADGTNLLNDATVGRAVNKLLTGVGA